MNSFGQLFRVSIYGESHGEGIGVVIDGCPVGIELETEDFLFDLSRRRAGKTGTTARLEKDIPFILSGIYEKKTTGAPINIFFKNENTDSKVYKDFKNHPRPGHSDYTAGEKYGGFNDGRGGGTFSGRVTLGLVAAGVVAKKILRKNLKDIEIKSRIISLGDLILTDNNNFENKEIDEKVIEKYLEKIQNEGDSVGGIIECRGIHIPKSLGEPFFDSVESIISHLVFSVGGVRGIEFGSGFENSRMKGSRCNDMIIDEYGKTLTNNCGGINGGITNGNEIVFRTAVKPTASIFKEQSTYSFTEKKVSPLMIKGRHDTAFVLRVPVVIEACLAIGLADLYLRNKVIKI